LETLLYGNFLQHKSSMKKAIMHVQYADKHTLAIRLAVLWSEKHNEWLGGLVVRTSDLRLAVAGMPPGHDTTWLLLR